MQQTYSQFEIIIECRKYKGYVMRNIINCQDFNEDLNKIKFMVCSPPLHTVTSESMNIALLNGF